MPVWIKHGLFGKGIKVIVIDTGIEKKHLDLVDNYVSKVDDIYCNGFNLRKNNNFRTLQNINT